ncbi:MAG: hypothetical protein QMC85_00900 [Methanocellales archaeon]|nr:hypothetical protein [Methanocellales archaeon]
MPRYGRGRGFWGPGFGMGFWGRGFGMGNPYPFCRRFPWMPRWWWTGMYGPITPYVPYGYGVPSPMLPAMGYPYGSYMW